MNDSYHGADNDVSRVWRESEKNPLSALYVDISKKTVACSTDYFTKNKVQPSLPELVLELAHYGDPKVGPRTQISLDPATGREAIDKYDASGKHTHTVDKPVGQYEERNTWLECDPKTGKPLASYERLACTGYISLYVIDSDGKISTRIERQLGSYHYYRFDPKSGSFKPDYLTELLYGNIRFDGKY
jgi:hypothetical protein